MLRTVLLLPVFMVVPAWSQTPAPAPCRSTGIKNGVVQNENRLQRDFRVEFEDIKCTKLNFGGLTDIGQTLVTGQPLHIAAGSLAPQNGFGAGLAFVEHKNFKNEWRVNWNADALATTRGAWRAGAYMKAYRLGAGNTVAASTTLNFYSETTSLTRVDYYGLGPATRPTSQTTFGMRENVTGVSGIIHLPGALAKSGLSLVAELNARFPSIRPGTDAVIPSIEQRFTEATAPGLTRQKVFFEPALGVRFAKPLFGDFVRVNYLLQMQEYAAGGDSAYSFRRWNADFGHTIPLYRVFPGKMGKAYSKLPAAGARPHNGPDDCATSETPSDTGRPCPPVSRTLNLEGSISLRLFMSESIANAGSNVPFFFSPTLGGSDINGNSMLASYPDYRFRGPDLLLMRGTFEHSLPKLPIGVMFTVDGGKIGLQRNDIAFNHLRHTYGAGLTIHAGGLPVFSLLFAWGGAEGHHTHTTIDPNLLGGGGRPSLF